MRTPSRMTNTQRSKLIPVARAFAQWRKHPKYLEVYDGLEEEFSLAAAMIRARTSAGLTQEELARRMKAKQSLIARLERVGTIPSTRTLRRFAEATGHRLKISFEPASRKGGARR